MLHARYIRGGKIRVQQTEKSAVWDVIIMGDDGIEQPECPEPITGKDSERTPVRQEASS